MKKFIAVIATLVIVSLPAAAQSKAKQSKPYTGDGGKGISLTVLVPRGSGLAADQNYLPELVQGEFVSNISGYSAISVLDRVNLDKIIAETLDPTYQDNLDIVRLGHVTHTAYIMTGTIIKTANGYNLQAQIAATADGMTKASYSGICTFAELDNLTGVRRASLELLGKMDVALTDQAKKELSGAAAANQVNAQTALARGIVAQRGGNVAETMARFYEANSYDPSLIEAATRANAMSSTVRTGNVGQNFRNDLAKRDEWREILSDAEDYLRRQRFVVAEMSYKNLRLKAGKANYQRDTMDFTYNPDNIFVKPLPYPGQYLRLIRDLNAGLRATGRNGDWKLHPLSPKDIIPRVRNDSLRYSLRDESIGSISITVSLKNSSGKVLSDKNFSVLLSTNNQGVGIFSWSDYLDMPKVSMPGIKTKLFAAASEGFGFSFSGMKFLTVLFFWVPDSDIAKEWLAEYDTFTVRANDITDEMSLEITAVGVDNSYLVRVIQE